jgi:hypothetical protein
MLNLPVGRGAAHISLWAHHLDHMGDGARRDTAENIHTQQDERGEVGTRGRETCRQTVKDTPQAYTQRHHRRSLSLSLSDRHIHTCTHKMRLEQEGRGEDRVAPGCLQEAIPGHQYLISSLCAEGSQKVAGRIKKWIRALHQT